MRRRIGSVGQVMPFGGLAQPVENQTRLDARQLCIGIDRRQAAHVLRVVEDHGHVGTLAGQAGARAPRQDCGSCCAAGGESGLHICGIAGHNDAHRKLAVVRRVGRVERPRAQVEPNISAKCGLEESFQLTVRSKALMLQRRLVHQDGKRRSGHGAMVARLEGRVTLLRRISRDWLRSDGVRQ